MSDLPRAPYPTNPRPYFFRMTAPQQRQYALDRMRADPRRTSIVSTACYLFGWEMTAELFKLHPGAIRNGGVWWVTFGVSALMVLNVMRNRDKLR